VGYWYTYIDPLATSSITPPPSESPSKPVMFSPARFPSTSTHALHASGYTTSYSGIGCLLNAPVIDAPWSTFDASRYSGIGFYAKGTGYGVRVLFHVPATVATQYHGTCTASVCQGALSRVYPLTPDTWTAISIPWSSLTPGTSPFDPAQLAAIEFQPGGIAGFDLWIDDVAFY
jgi:hypothetical protein